MTLIIGLSARKQGGKGTLAEFLTANGGYLFGFKPGFDGYGNYIVEHGTPSWVKVYSMAGPLKETCVNVLGLSPRQCYGSDEDKNSPTRYRWEDLPHYTTLVNEARERAWRELLGNGPSYTVYPGFSEELGRLSSIYTPAGIMTARQVLQEVGTGIFRRMWADVWNQACLRAIRRDNPDVAVIDDIRFPDEADAVLGAGGVVYRLTLAPFAKKDEHKSETSMDAYNRFTGVVGNARLPIRESCLALANLLDMSGVLRRPPQWDHLTFPKTGVAQAA
jgi:hypothetical protein